MKAQLTAFIGLRFLKSEWSQSASRILLVVALVGMALGLATFLVGQSILTTFQRTYLSSILGFNAHVIVVNDAERPFDLEENLLSLGQSGALQVSHYFFRDGVFLSPGRIASVMLKGVPVESLQTVYNLKYEFQSGASLASFSDTAGYRKILLGKKIYDEWLLSKKSNRVKIITANPTGPMVNLSAMAQTYEVIGSFESGLSEFDAKFILMNETAFAGQPHVNSGYEIKMRHPESALQLADQIQSMVPKGVEVIAWQELNEPLFAALKLEKAVFLLVMFFIVFIATLNIGGVILMIIYKKKEDLQWLRVLGLPQASIRWVLAWQAVFFAGVTIVAGYLLSWGLLQLIGTLKLISLDPQVYRMQDLKFEIAPQAYLVASLFVLIVSLLIAMRMSGWVLRKKDLMRDRGIS